MPTYWCVNFMHDEGLRFGIHNMLWLMGYQYARDQSDPAWWKARITENWNRLAEIKAGDRFIAYHSCDSFFATGTVRTPRRRMSIRDTPDTIENYLQERKSHRKGFVYFTDSVVYENFTDEWHRLPVRIDVEEWDNYVQTGVEVKVVNDVPIWERRKAVFEIGKRAFDRIAKKLLK